MSYQPEEKYWTDYLRIAFPVLGLLLLLGLFWYWAMALIDNNDEPQGTTVAQTTVTATSEAGNATGNEQVQLTVESSPANGGNATEETEIRPTRTPRTEESPTPESGESVGKFKEDDVVITTDQVNLRSSPEITDDNVVTTLPEGTELTVTGPSIEAEDYIWVPVVDTETGDQKGYIAEDLLDEA